MRIVCVFLLALAVSATVCNQYGVRRDCGYNGITQSECENLGCCYSEVSPNPYNIAWCFYSNPIPDTYYTDSYTPRNDGFDAVWKIKGNASTAFGDNIAPLNLAVTYYDENIIRVKLTDASNDRWELPEDLFPLPSSQSPFNPNFKVNYGQDPATVQIRRSDDEILFDTSVGPVYYTDMFLQLTSNLAQSPNVYGLGDHRDAFKLDDSNHFYTMWNHDTPTPADQNLYGSHPFFIEMRNGNAHGVFLRNSNGMDVVLNPGSITYKVIGGVLDFFIFCGPTPEAVIQQYHKIIGLPHMPPDWALGWHQSRYGFKSLSVVEDVVSKYASNNIPLDVMWNDIDYMDQYKDFTFDPTNFPLSTYKTFLSQLHNDNQKLVLIVDPGIRNTAGYGPYDDGESADVFIKTHDGTTDYVGSVWPGTTVFPNFLSSKGRDYWGNQISNWMSDLDIDGIWIDMNEPSSFVDGHSSGPSKYNNPPYKINNAAGRADLTVKTIAMDCVQYDDNGNQIPHYDVHNLFGFLEAVATKDALENKVHNGERSFVLTRSSFPGSGVYTAHWTGDNQASFDSMAASVRQVMNFNLFGIPLVGADICGFLGTTTEELCARWTALGAFYPFSRNHNTNDAPDQFPYDWDSVAAVARKTISAKYSLFPYYYTQFANVNKNGGTVARPLFFEFPSDSNTYSIGTQFMIGSSILVSPVLKEGATSVTAYFPDAKWYDFWTYAPLSGSGSISISASLQEIPVHIRGGSVLAMQKPGMTLAASRKNQFFIVVAPDSNGQASGEMYLDDGVSLDMSTNTQVSYSFSGKTLSSSVSSSSYSIPQTSEVIIAGVSSSVSSVTVNGNSWTSFSYDSSVKTLTVSGLTLDSTSSFSLSYD